jgi:hypothetical protein
MRALVVLLVIAAASPAWAHKPSDAHLRLALDGDTFVGRLEVSVRDLDAALGIDADGNGDITWGEITAARGKLDAYVAKRLVIAGDNTPCTLTLGEPALVDLFDGAYWTTPVSAACAKRPAELAVTYRLLFDIDAQHRGIVHIDGKTLIARDETPVRTPLDRTASSRSPFGAGARGVGLGLDHILLLACLLLSIIVQPASRDLRATIVDACELVIAFTLAQLVILVCCAIGVVEMPPAAIAAACAVSVVALALATTRGARFRWFLAAELGLLHGFGLWRVATEQGVSTRLRALVGFELGVAASYLVLAVAMVALLVQFRRALASGATRWATAGAIATAVVLWSLR